MSSDVRKGGPSTGKTRRNTAWRSPKRNIPFKCARWPELESDAGLSASVVPLRLKPQYFEQFVDRMHHPKETDYLFRLLRERSDKADEALSHVQADHDNAEGKLSALRQQLDDTVAGKRPASEMAEALRAFISDQKEHIRIEERDVFPLAAEVLTPEDWKEIDRAFLDHDDPVFGKSARAEFRELLHRIASLAPESVGLGGKTAGVLQSAAPKADVLLGVSDLESSYGRIKALKGISLEVRRGETVALVGANGAGKTTLLGVAPG